MLVIEKVVIAILVAQIIAGGSPELPKNRYISPLDLQHLAGAMEIENGSNGDKCLLYTGSVILNRVNSPHWDGQTIAEVITAKDSGYWQYARVTRDGFRTKKFSERTEYLARFLLIYGSILPENVVYQGQGKNGKGVYDSIDVPTSSKPELFCYE